MRLTLGTVAELERAAAAVARAWHAAGIMPLAAGLRGELGAGKTTWVRAALHGLGYEGRVPSPTYTLLEHYEVTGLVVVHVDLYRLESAEELEFIGLRDWLALPNLWLFVEWPDRAGRWAERLDLVLELSIAADEARELTLSAQTSQGRRALEACSELSLK